jgi:hypothetical protein
VIVLKSPSERINVAVCDADSVLTMDFSGINVPVLIAHALGNKSVKVMCTRFAFR